MADKKAMQELVEKASDELSEIEQELAALANRLRKAGDISVLAAKLGMVGNTEAQMWKSCFRSLSGQLDGVRCEVFKFHMRANEVEKSHGVVLPQVRGGGGR